MSLPDSNLWYLLKVDNGAGGSNNCSSFKPAVVMSDCAKKKSGGWINMWTAAWKAPRMNGFLFIFMDFYSFVLAAHQDFILPQSLTGQKFWLVSNENMRKPIFDLRQHRTAFYLGKLQGIQVSCVFYSWNNWICCRLMKHFSQWSITCQCSPTYIVGLHVQ